MRADHAFRGFVLLVVQTLQQKAVLRGKGGTVLARQ